MVEGVAPARVEILVVGYANSPSVAGTVGLVRDGDRVIVVDPGMVKSRSLILDPLERLVPAREIGRAHSLCAPPRRRVPHHGGGPGGD